MSEQIERTERTERTMTSGDEIAVVTGVSRAEGLGFEICRQLGQRGMMVILTARDGQKAKDLAERLREDRLQVRGLPLDVASDQSATELAGVLAEDFGRVDVLINHAGKNLDLHTGAADVPVESVRDMLETNLLGAWRVSKVMLPLLQESRSGRIVNVSSEAGSFGAAQGLPAHGSSLAAYGVSKAALNALTVKLAAALRDERILVNAVCPGFVATLPGTTAAGARPVADGARGVVWAACLPVDGPTGGFFRDGRPLPW